jgi:transposase
MLTRHDFQTIYEQGPETVFATVTLMQTTLATQQEQIVALTLRVKELEDRLGKDSHNSSKPPSSDGFARKPVSLRQRTGRKPGAQPGHPGKTLSLTDTPDAVVVHAPEQCAGCGLALVETAGQPGERRQVLDLPPLRLVVTEHQSQRKTCPGCGAANRGVFPAEVSQTAQYGPRVKALGVYLASYQLLPYARIAGLFADLFAAPLSPGTLCAAQQAGAKTLSGVLSGIKEALQKAAVVHFDETGLRVGGKLRGLHSAGTSSLTYYDWHERRGKDGMSKAGVLSDFDGVAVHDGWASYFHYGCRHALCNAHHLRELTALHEQDEQAWAASLRSLLVEIKKAVERAKERGEKKVSCLLVCRLEAQYKQLLSAGFAANPPPETPLLTKRGRVKQSKARNLLLRLEAGMEQTLAFLYDFAVPFDNNLAERDVRMMKVKQKVSGGFRSAGGADAFCKLRSYISTLRKQGRSVLPALEHVFLGKPILPQIAG